MVTPDLNGIAKKYVESIEEAQLPEEPKPMGEVVVEMVAYMYGYSRKDIGWVKTETFVNLDEMR